MNQSDDNPGTFAEVFEEAFAYFQATIVTGACSEDEWPVRVALAVRAGLQFAAENPVSAQILTNEALARGPDGIALYERLTAYLTEMLLPGRDLCPEGERLPEITERAMASGVVMLVAQRLDRRQQDELPAIAGEAIQFVLTPYLGADRARRIGAEYAT